MKLIRCLLLLALGVCGAACHTPAPAPAPTAAPPTSAASDLASPIDLWWQAWVERAQLSGVILLARGDEIVYQRAVGYADRARRVPNRMDTQFDIGSVAKPLLATVILRLVERGVLQLDQAVAGYVSELVGTPAGAVTLEQLLAHQGGLPDHDDVEGFFTHHALAGEGAEPLDRQRLLAMFSAAPLLFAPGEAFAYSNFGYSALALAAERASGRPYPALLHEHVFEPAGMTASLWDDGARDGEDRALGYVVDLPGRVHEAPRLQPLASLGAGDVLSTARDLWRFHRALEGGVLLTARSRETMFRSRSQQPQRGRGYALGWETSTFTPEVGPAAGRQLVTQSHGGLALGYLSLMERLPEINAFFVVLSNVRPSDDLLNNVPPPDIRRIQADLRRFLTGDTAPPPGRRLARLFLKLYPELGCEAALAEAERRHAADPGRYEVEPNTFMLAGYEVLEQGAATEALRVGEYALAKDPTSWLLQEAVGDFRLEVGDRAGALAAYEQALRTMPDRAYLQERVQSLRRSPSR